MTRSESVAEYFRTHGRRRLDRVEVRDGGRNARCALALLDAAAYAGSLDDGDPLITGLVEAGCFGPGGDGPFDPGDEGLAIVKNWESGEPWQLLFAIRSAAAQAGAPA
ncbi:hypothetical protein HNP84_004939 [Thermocatellispora tengchongensis]|uniref:Uncharacterized protein n=1 Tax=Thermocatellispora tengchongensis TaxID=1073253 RepID=A0A840PB94_9ACTN|nr:hypothetical protein [Thermocatellispora tengchongensis]MBB5135203.1 hypothetical protein [Thermocatellispora tengchongensis]